MPNLQPEAAARNAGQAVASAVRPRVPSKPPADAYAVAYRACAAHPARTDLASIRQHLEALRALCRRFAHNYPPDAIRSFLDSAGLSDTPVSDDFEFCRTNVANLAWLLDLVGAGIDPTCVVAITPPPAEGGAR